MAETTDSIKTKRMPVLFVGHGSPENAIMANAFTRQMKRLGEELPRPKAILAISAHWLTRGTWVTGMDRPRTIHDFYGFPREMYDLQYPCPGSPGYAREVQNLITTTKVGWNLDWGLDHGTWTILSRIYPAADIPTFQLSIDYDQPPEYHYALAKELAPLREEGVLIVGSGNITHNLRLNDYPDLNAQPGAWAVEFDEKVKASLLRRDHAPLVHYQNWGRVAALAVPTNDHYLPMLYAAALQEEGSTVKFVY